MIRVTRALGGTLMIIAQISDTHIALDTPDADRRLSDFARTIAHINALDPPPDVIIHTGDIVHNGWPDEYAAAVAVLARGARARSMCWRETGTTAPTCAPRFRGLDIWRRESDFIQYAIEDFSVRLLVLDTLSTASNKGDFCAERARHLIEMIDADTTRPIAVFAHHPPFEVLVGPDRIHFADMAAIERLREALVNAGRVVGVFCGHVHRPTTGAVAHIPATVATSVATTLRNGEYPAEMKDRPIYLLHRFDPDGRFVTETQIV